MKKRLIVLQESAKDCGAACLLSIIRYYSGDISLERLTYLTKTTKDGTTFYNISKTSEMFGLKAEAYYIDDFSKLKSLKAPYITQVKKNNYMHFTVVYKVYDDKILIMDPASGKETIDYFDFTNIFAGNVLLFEKIGNCPIFDNEKVLNKKILITLFKNRKIITFLIILSIIFSLLSCVISLYSQIIFDYVIDTTYNNLIIITIFFSILNIIKIITSYIRNYLLIYLNQKIDISVVLNTFSKIILLPFNYYKSKTAGDILTRINDLSNIKNLISKIIIIVFVDLFMLIISSLIIFRISKKILFLLFIINFIYFLIILIFNKYLKRLLAMNAKNTSLLNNNIIENIKGFETIKNLNIQKNIIYKFSDIYTKGLDIQYRYNKTNNIIILLKDLIMDGILLLINFLLFKYIINNNLTVGEYITISFLESYIISPIKTILETINEYHNFKIAISRANNLLLMKEEEINDNVNLIVNGNIVFNNINYSYDNKNLVLKNINFYIKDKDRVLLLGPSGCGKSTIMKLIYKYYNIKRESIFINNYDINDYSLSDIRNNILYISQNEILFTDTIRNNILSGRDIPEEDFLNICKIVYIDDIIKDNPLGYDYVIEEDGVNLSGGQRQRIILARGLLKQSKIIMIDESFSEIDTNLERKILKNIFNYFKDQTFIVISHRTNNVELFNRVITINQNTVSNLESGE